MRSQLSLAFVGILFLLSGCARPAPQFLGQLQRTEPWAPELIERMAEVPVQDNGRVKPLGSYASFLLYSVHGRRDVKFQIGDEKYRLEPTEWLLDAWCFPEQAANYPLFRIENTAVLDDLEIPNDGQTPDFVYVSYNTIMKHVDRLREQYGRSRQIPEKRRSIVQQHILKLGHDVIAYQGLHRLMMPFQGSYTIEGDKFRAVFGGRSQVTLGELAAKGEAFASFKKSLGADPGNPDLGNAANIQATLERMGREEDSVTLFPPPGEGEVWVGPAAVAALALQGSLPASHTDALSGLSATLTATDMAGRVAGLDRYREGAIAAAEARGEYEKVPLEANYHRKSWHFHAMFSFILAFALAAGSWVFTRKAKIGRLLFWSSIGVTLMALALLTWDITLRCIITERPPITRLYDTFLFIGAFSVLTCVVLEWVWPRRIGLALGPLLGSLLIMGARWHELDDARDTMDPLMAVLDSNYWLATHVTMINIGYAAGVVAAVLANVWVFVRVLRIAPPTDSLSQGLIRAVYGVTCFSLIFSLIGTIYGGVWANDSWGRFWGWDPKENGALMICVAQVALLHARSCGWIRDLGIVVFASITGMVVLFSWFHTNLLGIGLHSYGFSSGKANLVWTWYVFQLGVVLLGVIDVMLRPNPAGPAGPASSSGAGSSAPWPSE